MIDLRPQHLPFVIESQPLRRNTAARLHNHQRQKEKDRTSVRAQVHPDLIGITSVGFTTDPIRYRISPPKPISIKRLPFDVADIKQ